MTRLKELRRNAGETQEKIAALVGVTRGAYANIENDKREPDFQTLFTLADHWDVTLDYLLGRTATPPKQNDNMVYLTTHEKDLMTAYRQADARSRQMVELALEPFTPAAQKAAASPKGA